MGKLLSALGANPIQSAAGITQTLAGIGQMVGSAFGRRKLRRAMSRQEGYMEGEIANIEKNEFAKEGLALSRRLGGQGLSPVTIGIQQQGAERAQSGLIGGLGTMGRGAALAAAGRVGLMQQDAAQNLSLQNEQALLRNRANLFQGLKSAEARTDKVAGMRIGLAEARYSKASNELLAKKKSFAQGIQGLAMGLTTLAGGDASKMNQSVGAGSLVDNQARSSLNSVGGGIDPYQYNQPDVTKSYNRAMFGNRQSNRSKYPGLYRG